MEELWASIFRPPRGCIPVVKKHKTPNELVPGTVYPKPSLWNIHQFMQFQSLEMFKIEDYVTKPSRDEIDFRVFTDFQRTVTMNNPLKVFNSCYVVDSRYEACTSVIVESLIDCVSRAMGLTITPEFVINSSGKDIVFGGCRIDFTLSSMGEVLGLVEVKNGTGDFAQGIGQLLVYMVQLTKPAFGLLTDGYRFLFVKTDPNQTGHCFIASKMLYLNESISFEHIVNTWIQLIREQLEWISTKHYPVTHPCLYRIAKNFEFPLWKSLEIEHHYVYQQQFKK
jgi:hypothetical protein